MCWAGFPALSSSIDFDDDIPPSLATSSSLDPTRLPTLNACTDPFLTFAENEARSSNDAQLINTADEPLGQQQENEQALNKFDYGPMADLCVCSGPRSRIPALIFRPDTI